MHSNLLQSLENKILKIRKRHANVQHRGQFLVAFGFLRHVFYSQLPGDCLDRKRRNR